MTLLQSADAVRNSVAAAIGGSQLARCPCKRAIIETDRTIDQVKRSRFKSRWIFSPHWQAQAREETRRSINARPLHGHKFTCACQVAKCMGGYHVVSIHTWDQEDIMGARIIAPHRRCRRRAGPISAGLCGLSARCVVAQILEAASI